MQDLSPIIARAVPRFSEPKYFSVHHVNRACLGDKKKARDGERAHRWAHMGGASFLKAQV